MLTLVVSLAVASATLLALSSFSIRVITDSRVQVVADSAALAGALASGIDGKQSANEIATANGATLCGFKQTTETVAARVCLGRSTAWSFARNQQLSQLPTLKE